METYRSLLRLILRSQVSDQLVGKVDLSGIVQQTLFEAHANEAALQSWNEERRVGWLRQAILNNLRDEIRKLKLSKRTISLDQDQGSGFGTLADLVAADHTSPGHGATRNEMLLRLADSLEQLPVDQRRAIELHHLDGLTLVATAERMEKTVQSVVGLVFRGLKQLKSDLRPQ